MAKPRIPYFDFYPTDFMHGVRGLTAQEVGIYTMLLCRIYEENGPVQYHPARLSAYCGTREAIFIKAFERLVNLGKFSVRDGMFTNARAELEIESRERKLKINSRAGKISAQKRQQSQEQEATGVGRTFNHTDTDTEVSGGGGGARATDPDQTYLERVCAASGKPFGSVSIRGKVYLPDESDCALIRRWRDDLGLTEDQVVAEVDRITRTKRDGPPKTLDYFAEPLDRLATKLKSKSPLNPIEGASHDGQSPRTSRQAAASDATGRALSFAARARRTPDPDCF